MSGIGVRIREVSGKERLSYYRGVRIGEVPGKERWSEKRGGLKRELS